MQKKSLTLLIQAFFENTNCIAYILKLTLTEVRHRPLGSIPAEFFCLSTCEGEDVVRKLHAFNVSEETARR